MFIAVRDLLHAKGRFLLMGFVIALVAYLMRFLSGLSTLLARECHQRRVATRMVTHDPAMLESVDRVVSIVDGRPSATPGASHAAH
jgi:hypothetical protein